MKLKRKDCLICDRATNKYLNICDDCHSLLVPKKEGVVKGFKNVDRAYACYYYSPIVSESLRRYKFGNQRYFFNLFSELLLEKIMDLKLYNEVEVLIPVPLHRDTLIKRGFNQIELLTENISKIIRRDHYTDVLIKTKATLEQAKLDSLSRGQNLKGAFNIKNPEKIMGKNLLLVDDMITTGATVEECGKALKEAGAEKVIVISIATTS